MKKYLLHVLTGVGLVAFLSANAKAQVAFSIYAEPSYYGSGYRADYFYGPDHRYYYHPPYYYYYRPYYYHRWHRWHYHHHWRANEKEISTRINHEKDIVSGLLLKLNIPPTSSV